MAYMRVFRFFTAVWNSNPFFGGRIEGCVREYFFLTLREK